MDLFIGTIQERPINSGSIWHLACDSFFLAAENMGVQDPALIYWCSWTHGKNKNIGCHLRGYRYSTHRIHVWYICWHLGYIDGKCHHIYTIHGSYGLCIGMIIQTRRSHSSLRFCYQEPQQKSPETPTPGGPDPASVAGAWTPPALGEFSPQGIS